MRPIMTSPCSVCGVTLTHDQDPRTVLCGGCKVDARVAARKNAPPSPLTVEYHRRVPDHTPTMFQPGYRVLPLFVMIGIGFIWGWIAWGGQ